MQEGQEAKPSLRQLPRDILVRTVLLAFAKSRQSATNYLVIILFSYVYGLHLLGYSGAAIDRAFTLPFRREFTMH
jgi:hypothetical protein